MNGSCHWCLEMTPYQFEMCWDADGVMVSNCLEGVEYGKEMLKNE